MRYSILCLENKMVKKSTRRIEYSTLHSSTLISVSFKKVKF